MKNYSKIFLLGTIFLCGALFLCNSAAAIPSSLFIDFRNDEILEDWSAADGEESWTVHYAFGDVTASAYILNDPNDPLKAILYQDTKDGLGIKDDEENDEINLLEKLVIEISNGGTLLTGVWITDLFRPTDGGVGEHGKYQLNDGEWKTFNALDPGQTNGNGELFVSFGGAVNVFKAVFMANNDIQGIVANDNEYSVAGFTNPVPEPATMLLLGIGLIGIAGVSRKKLFKKNNA